MKTKTKSDHLTIGLMLQSYDLWDVGFFMKSVWKRCLRWGEKNYGLQFDLKTLYEDDIISGRLKKEGFDILIGPGGSGSWHAHEDYRERIKDYVASGGRYLGVCGDSCFGTLGFANLSPRLERIFIKQVGRIKTLQPFLGLVNRYADLGALDRINGWRIKALALNILFSPVNFYFTETGISTLKPYMKRIIKVNWGFMVATSEGEEGENIPAPNTDIIYADDWVFPQGSLQGKPAQLSSRYGNGKVILTGLHAELRKRTYDIVIRNILWLTDLEEKALNSPVTRIAA
jgi:glutamine amidotransferase-like uncharacterized protein